MNRYMAFVYDNYYPCGGFHDLLGFFSNIKDIASEILNQNMPYDNHEIYDTVENNIIFICSEELDNIKQMSQECTKYNKRGYKIGKKRMEINKVLLYNADTDEFVECES